MCCAGTLALQAQLQVTNGNTAPYTPQNLISNIFLGEGVEVTSITYGGDPEAVGYFNTGTQAIGIERGIILTSGSAETLSPIILGCNEKRLRLCLLRPFAQYHRRRFTVHCHCPPARPGDLHHQIHSYFRYAALSLLFRLGRIPGVCLQCFQRRIRIFYSGPGLSATDQYCQGTRYQSGGKY